MLTSKIFHNTTSDVMYCNSHLWFQQVVGPKANSGKCKNPLTDAYSLIFVCLCVCKEAKGKDE